MVRNEHSLERNRTSFGQSHKESTETVEAQRAMSLGMAMTALSHQPRQGESTTFPGRRFSDLPASDGDPCRRVCMRADRLAAISDLLVATCRAHFDCFWNDRMFCGPGVVRFRLMTIPASSTAPPGRCAAGSKRAGARRLNGHAPAGASSRMNWVLRDAARFEPDPAALTGLAEESKDPQWYVSLLRLKAPSDRDAKTSTSWWSRLSLVGRRCSGLAPVTGANSRSGAEDHR